MRRLAAVARSAKADFLRKDDDLTAFLEALKRRHLADLTVSEAARALRALSSCYVERRRKLATGGALDSAGKRAAFALFYAPVHFLVTREIVRAVPGATSTRVTTIVDLGCGTGAAGAAWALEIGSPRVNGIDRHPWAVAEANWTYRQLGVRGRAMRGDISRLSFEADHRTGIVSTYTVNELADDVRARLLTVLLQANARGARVLIVEPIGRRLVTWWSEWADEFRASGGRDDEWRFPIKLPQLQRDLARAAGLDPRELTARSLFLAAS